MIVYEVVGGLVVLGLIFLGMWKFSDMFNLRKGRSK